MAGSCYTVRPGPESGWLACRNTGAGRLTDPTKIVEQITHMLTTPGAMPPVVGSHTTELADNKVE